MAFITHVRNQQAQLLASRGYGFFSKYTDEQIAKALNISVKVVSIARAIAFDSAQSASVNAYRAGFNGSKS